MKTRKDSGMSLIEVVIASVILLIVVLITMGILFTSTTMVNKDSRAAGLQHRGRVLLEFCRDQWYTGLFRNQNNPPPTDPTALGIFDQNTSVRFQVPVRQKKDPTTGVLTGAMDFGYAARLGYNGNTTDRDPSTGAYMDPEVDPKSGAFQGPKTCIIRFEADTVFWESRSATPSTVNQIVPISGTPSTLPPLPTFPATSSGGSNADILNADANKNGNQNDVFVRGKIKKYVLFSPALGQKIESVETLDDYVILGVDPATGQFNGRIDPITGAANPNDPDGVYRGDWLFRYLNQAGGTDFLSPFPVSSISNPTLPPTIGVQVTVWHGDWDENKKGFLIWKNRETIRYRNPQNQ
jgi:prepilin-type N-terminal cleavage/methylation domain-containing protein